MMSGSSVKICPEMKADDKKNLLLPHGIAYDTSHLSIKLQNSLIDGKSLN